jgi:hypothetical protein
MRARAGCPTSSCTAPQRWRFRFGLSSIGSESATRDPLPLRRHGDHAEHAHGARVARPGRRVAFETRNARGEKVIERGWIG